MALARICSVCSATEQHGSVLAWTLGRLRSSVCAHLDTGPYRNVARVVTYYEDSTVPSDPK